MANSFEFNGKNINVHGDGWIFVNRDYLKYQGKKVRKASDGCYYDDNDFEIKNLSGKSLEEVLNLCMKWRLARLLALFFLNK